MLVSKLSFFQTRYECLSAIFGEIDNVTSSLFVVCVGAVEASRFAGGRWQWSR